MRILKLSDQDLAGKRVFIRADLNVPQDDDGRITDAQGRTVDFRDTVVIMTSNIGSSTCSKA